MIAILAIARATLPMLARQKLLIVPVIAVGLSLVALVGALISNDAPIELERAEAELFAYMVGAFSGLGGAVYATIVGASLISREISDGTLLMLAVRPIARWKIVVGRLLGAAVFLLASLLLVAFTYGVVSSLVSGMLAPFDEPFRGLALALPVVALALCVSAALGVQGRATAAIGSAIGVCVFAFFISFYVDSWRDEGHMRSYLVADVRDHVDPPDPVIGPLAWGVVRILPFGVFGSQVAATAEDRARDLDELSGASYPEGKHVDEIDTLMGYGIAYGTAVGTPVVADPAALVDPATGEPVVEPTTPSDPAAGAATDPAVPEPGDPAAATPGALPEPAPRPASPTKESFACAEVSGWSCFMGFSKAWKQRYVPNPPELHEDGGYWWALLAIPLWIAIAAALLTRRRDLTA